MSYLGVRTNSAVSISVTLASSKPHPSTSLSQSRWYSCNEAISVVTSTAKSHWSQTVNTRSNNLRHISQRQYTNNLRHISQRQYINNLRHISRRQYINSVRHMNQHQYINSVRHMNQHQYITWTNTNKSIAYLTWTNTNIWTAYVTWSNISTSTAKATFRRNYQHEAANQIPLSRQVYSFGGY